MVLSIILAIVLTLMAVVCFVFTRSAWARWLMIAVYLFSLAVVIFPELSGKIAAAFGIGRGVDFILIVATVALTNGLIFYTRYLMTMRRNITKLTRYIAKRDAISPDV